MSRQACPQCGAVLRRWEIEQKSVAFPCPTCGVQLQLPDWYLMLSVSGALAAPPLIFWALGFSWRQFIIAELLVGYPFLWLVAHYLKYIVRPKLVFAIPRPPLGSRTELNLRDRPHEWPKR